MLFHRSQTSPYCKPHRDALWVTQHSKIGHAGQSSTQSQSPFTLTQFGDKQLNFPICNKKLHCILTTILVNSTCHLTVFKTVLLKQSHLEE